MDPNSTPNWSAKAKSWVAAQLDSSRTSISTVQDETRQKQLLFPSTLRSPRNFFYSIYILCFLAREQSFFSVVLFRYIPFLFDLFACYMSIVSHT